MRMTIIALAGLLWASSSHASHDSIRTWAQLQMESWAPPGHTWRKEAREDPASARSRYSDVAAAAAAVAYDPSEPPLFGGPDGRARTLALMLAVADSESGFRKDVDLGSGEASRGDHGESWCLMQIRLSPAVDGSTRRRIVMDGDAWTLSDSGGWTGQDLVRDRTKCFRAGLHMMRVSMRACKGLSLEDRLSLYTSGNCQDGRASSRNRMVKAMRWLRKSPPPYRDDAVVASSRTSVSPPALEVD